MPELGLAGAPPPPATAYATLAISRRAARFVAAPGAQGVAVTDDGAGLSVTRPDPEGGPPYTLTLALERPRWLRVPGSWLVRRTDEDPLVDALFNRGVEVQSARTLRHGTTAARVQGAEDDAGVTVSAVGNETLFVARSEGRLRALGSRAEAVAPGGRLRVGPALYVVEVEDGHGTRTRMGASSRSRPSRGTKTLDRSAADGVKRPPTLPPPGARPPTACCASPTASAPRHAARRVGLLAALQLHRTAAVFGTLPDWVQADTLRVELTAKRCPPMGAARVVWPGAELSWVNVGVTAVWRLRDGAPRACRAPDPGRPPCGPGPGPRGSRPARAGPAAVARGCAPPSPCSSTPGKTRAPQTCRWATACFWPPVRWPSCLRGSSAGRCRRPETPPPPLPWSARRRRKLAPTKMPRRS